MKSTTPLTITSITGFTIRPGLVTSAERNLESADRTARSADRGEFPNARYPITRAQNLALDAGTPMPPPAELLLRQFGLTRGDDESSLLNPRHAHRGTVTLAELTTVLRVLAPFVTQTPAEVHFLTPEGKLGSFSVHDGELQHHEAGQLTHVR